MPGTLLDVYAIFQDAVDIESVDDRARFVAQAAGDDPQLRQRVEALLQAHSEAGDYLGGKDPELKTTNLVTNQELLGTSIGPYKLREVLGEGGMGIVYAAEQEQPLRRKVALKVVKPGMDSKEIVRRFEAERQALALMDHPNIAKVIDAGTTDSGRPYFAMELVRGMPITEYCDQVRFSLRERLRLFIIVCQAVQHAHQKGIIHRDLKPSNVMITLHDGTPVPKIIDFGIAKALNQRLTEQTLYTKVNSLVGTPMYMSPEQAELSGLDIDTRSDVYSLGALLYELLTGHTPFDKDVLSKVGYDEFRRIIREDEPPRPSQRVSTLGMAGVSTEVEWRRIDARQLTKSLRGELDWIVMKALEKDRTRRYGSADAVASDLQAYLDDQPVQACPPSWSYRLRKFARRKRQTISGIALAFTLGLVFAALIVVVKDRTGKEVAKIALPDGGTVAIIGDDKSPALTSNAAKRQSHEKPPLPELIPQPYEIPGLGRWQLISKGPGSFVHHNWKLAWSPDSRYVAFGDGYDVRVHSVPSLHLVRVLSGHTNSVVSVDWSPDGKQIASSSVDNTIRLWDAETGVPGPILLGHRDRVDAVAWHPDSQRLASGSRDFSVRLWTNHGTTGPVLFGHTDSVYSVAWNHDGSRLASTGEDGTIRIWNLDAKSEGVIETSRRQQTVSWTPDGKQILTGQFSAGSSRLWNLDGTPGLIFNGHTDHVAAAAISPDGSQVASASWDNTARIWNIDGTAGPVLSGFDGDVYAVQWSPNGRWIATGSGERSIRLWHVDGQPGAVRRGNRSVSSVCWRPDGRSFAAGIGDHTIRICDENGRQEKVLEGHTRSVLCIDWNTDGRRIISGGADGVIRVWNVEDGTIEASMTDNQAHVTFALWSPNGKRFAITRTIASDEPKIHLHEFDGKPVAVLEGHRSYRAYGAAWNRLDGRLASVGSDGTARLWTRDGKLDETFNIGGLVAAVAWRPDGQQLATGSDNGTIQLWQPDGQPGRLLKGHSDRVSSIVWSRDGRWIASGGRDNTVRVWSANGEPLEIFRGHTEECHSVAWCPHTPKVLSGGHDGTLRLWNVEIHQPEWILFVLRDQQVMKFSPDGHRLSGDANVFESEFAYIIEQPTGAMEIVTPSEFERRLNQAY